MLEIKEVLEIKKETRQTSDRFYWYWTTLSGATLVLLFNFIKDLKSIDHFSKNCIRFAVWYILAGFILSPLRNFFSNYITMILNLIGSDKDKDGGRTLIRRAKIFSFVRNIFALFSIAFYIFGLILTALAVNVLFLK